MIRVVEWWETERRGGDGRLVGWWVEEEWGRRGEIDLLIG